MGLQTVERGKGVWGRYDISKPIEKGTHSLFRTQQISPLAEVYFIYRCKKKKN